MEAIVQVLGLLQWGVVPKGVVPDRSAALTT
jgi:hypothetical protein